MKITSRRSNTRGFTLIEVTIAIAVFSLLMVLFAASIPLSEKASVMNGQYAQALSLGQHKIDQMRAIGYGRLTYQELNDANIVDDSPTTSPYSFAAIDSISNYLISPTATIVIADVSGYVGKIRLATVTITWKTTAYETKTSTITLYARIANPG